jgi:predicted dehydrogenase
MALSKMNDLHVVALCDSSEKTVTDVARQWRVDHYYTKFSDMLRNEDLSIATIITPPQSHASLIIEAISHDVNLLVEKPLALSTSQADLIMKSLEKSQVKLTVVYNVLLSKAMLQGLSLIKKGEIGEALAVRINYLDTVEDQMTADKNHWAHKLPGGRFGEMLSHPVYLAQSVLGNHLKVDTVIAQKRSNLPWMIHDELHVMLRGTQGLASIYCSFNAPRMGIIVEIFGSKKMLQVDLVNQTLVALGPRKLGKIDSAIDSLRVSGTLISQTARNAFTYLSRRRGESAIGTVYSSLVESIRENQELTVTPEMAANTVRIAEDVCNRL